MSVNDTSFVLQTAKNNIYEEIYKGMMADPSNMVKSSTFAYDRVAKDNFAYMNDVTMLQRAAARNNCKFRLIKERFYKSGFGLAVRQGSPYKEHFDKV